LTSELTGHDAAGEHAAESLVLRRSIQHGSTRLDPFGRKLAVINGQF
jgi:hypothetical protein